VNKRLTLMTAGLVTVLVAGVGTAALAASAQPVDSSGVIHGCYTNAEINGSHIIVLQDAGTSCPGGDTAISWNQQGPAGHNGANGTNGTPGAQGPAGPSTAGSAGLDVKESIAQGTGLVLVNCPGAAPYATGGGGFDLAGGGLQTDTPVATDAGVPDGWEVEAANPGDEVTAIAICSR
jgi:hypothetical protein